ncbi:hypothetical protein B0H11DRAFT_2076283 [Mycena galericulata]|nr:hypothetical protein B0H11DRAFT_2076283 [Mycena galericulata]
MTRCPILLDPTSLCLNTWDIPSKWSFIICTKQTSNAPRTRLKRSRLRSFNPHGFFKVLPSGSMQGDGSLLGSSWALRVALRHPVARAKCRISTPALHTLRKPFRSAGKHRISKVHAPARTQRPPHRTRTTTTPPHTSPPGLRRAKSDGVSQRRRRTSAPCARMFWIRPWRGASGLESGASVSFRKHGASTLLRVRVRGDVVAVLGRAYPKGDISAAYADGAKPVAGRAAHRNNC